MGGLEDDLPFQLGGFSGSSRSFSARYISSLDRNTPMFHSLWVYLRPRWCLNQLHRKYMRQLAFVFFNKKQAKLSKIQDVIWVKSIVISPTKLIHPGRLTWNQHITRFERKMIFQTSMIMFHVNLPGCSWRDIFFFRHVFTLTACLQWLAGSASEPCRLGLGYRLVTIPPGCIGNQGQNWWVTRGFVSLNRILYIY